MYGLLILLFFLFVFFFVCLFVCFCLLMEFGMILVVNIVTNSVIKVLGKLEGNTRFLLLALFQGKTTGSVATENLQANAKLDPTLLCTAFKKNRFYLFSRRGPQEERYFSKKKKKKNLIHHDVVCLFVFLCVCVKN